MERYNKFLPELIEETSDLSFYKFSEYIHKNDHKRAKISWMKALFDYFRRDLWGEKNLPRKISEPEEKQLVSAAAMEIPTWIAFSFMAQYFRQPREKQLIHVIQPDFFDKFRRLDFSEIQYRHLPKNISGFVQLPTSVSDGEHMFDNFFFFTGKKEDVTSILFKASQNKDYDYEEDGNVMAFGFVDTTYTHVSFFWRAWPKDETMTVKVSAANISNITLRPEKPFVPEVTEMEDGYSSHISLIVNILAYLKSGDPDIREYTNPVKFRSPTSTKPVRADSGLSLSRIVQVGFSFKKERLQHTDEWYVMPHMRWQRYGPELSQVKVVLVKGHTKSWKENVEQQVV